MKYYQLKKIINSRLYYFRWEHGGSTFIDIEDGKGKLQVYFKKDKLGNKNYKFLTDNFGRGDFIEVNGVLFTTNGEKKA